MENNQEAVSSLLKKMTEISKKNGTVEDFMAFLVSNFQITPNPVVDKKTDFTCSFCKKVKPDPDVDKVSAFNKAWLNKAIKSAKVERPLSFSSIKENYGRVLGEQISSGSPLLDEQLKVDLSEDSTQLSLFEDQLRNQEVLEASQFLACPSKEELDQLFAECRSPIEDIVTTEKITDESQNS